MTMKQKNALMLLLFGLNSCQLEDTFLEETLDLSMAEQVYEGTFQSANGYTTNGRVKIVVHEGQAQLVFEDFMTSPGPDLKVYLSKATRPTDIIDLGELKANNGTFTYPLISHELEGRGYVLIWCRRFSRLFGSAVLNRR